MTDAEPVLLVADGLVGHAPPARAVLVVGERIAWVGADPDDAPRLAGVPARRTELAGGWLAPAFVDAHVHGTLTGLAAAGVDLTTASSLAAALALVRDHAVASAPGDVLLGSGWDDSAWPEQRPPSADELTTAAPGRTVLLARVDVHSCVVDRATLAALDLDGVDGVARDGDGLPTGWLREQATALARRHVNARLRDAQLRRARETFARQAAVLGIATVHEMGHPDLMGLDDARAWATGRWPVEVLSWWAALDVDAALDLGLRPGGDLYLDGSIGSRTAAVTRPYRDGGHGELFLDDETVTAFFTAATRRGVGAGVHAIGDRAVAQALTALEEAAAACGVAAVRRSRHRLEHVEMVDGAQASRLAVLGVVASVQPAFDAWWGGVDGLYAQRFGPEAACDLNPLARLAEAGVAMAFGSDTTVTPLDPWGGVVAAERHRGGHGIPRRDAFAAATVGGRYVGGQDDVGALRTDARADLAVWDRDPFAVEDPRATRCVATVVGGRIAHGALTGLPPR